MTAILWIVFGAAVGGAVVFYNYYAIKDLVPKRFGGNK